MRICIRCNTKMVENCGIKVKGARYGVVLTDDEDKWFGGRLGEPKVAICPSCGEVSIYLEDVNKLKNQER
ncbi:nucleic acid-binding protein [Facklamia sp. DSM 111018]|uniref:Nucleic acid-binding protein n=1 Tax=Facklamia lactis TaxID=2749967 RepID=A0ABS0LSH5_9LACT|nr:nucleic acid-binding protein [Facklamia lactis]MBG9986209.1 nucleic acid-binding protein [Facklamia lactis]